MAEAVFGLFSGKQAKNGFLEVKAGGQRFLPSKIPAKRSSIFCRRRRVILCRMIVLAPFSGKEAENALEQVKLSTLSSWRAHGEELEKHCSDAQQFITQLPLGCQRKDNVLPFLRFTGAFTLAYHS